MVKWKLFSKNKKEKEPETKKEEMIELEVEEEPQEEKTEEIQQEELKQVEINEEDEKTLAEYKETLYTSDVKNVKNQEKSDQHIWRDVDSIEKNIDTLHIKTSKSVDELDKKVDGIIKKTKQKHRKPSNVIYVVSKPQPGEVKGDWAVRSHGKIYSHHKTKEKAIEEARKIAIKRNATVMVQNTDGTFSDGFKPRKK